MTQPTPVPAYAIHDASRNALIPRSRIDALVAVDRYDPAEDETFYGAAVNSANGAFQTLVGEFDTPAERDEYIRTDPQGYLS